MSLHKLIYYDARGHYRDTFTRFINLSYSRAENDYGSMYLDLPPDIDPNLFEKDGKFEIQRAYNGISFRNEMQTMWFVRLIRTKTDQNGKRLTHILAYDANELIERRIVAYKSGTTQADKKDIAADTMIRQIMRENFGTLATDTVRDMSKYITISDDNAQSGAPVISKAFAYQKILPLFKDICDEAYTNNNFYMAFDMTPIDPNRFMFNIYYKCRGSDRGSTSKYPLVFGIGNGGLSYFSYAKDYSEERNYIYAGGSGEEEDRVLKTAEDANSIGASPFGRREDFISNSDKDPNVVQSAANSRLSEAKSKIVINGHVQQMPNLQFGTHYNFGDIVTIAYGRNVYNVHLDAVSVNVDETQKEDIKINSRNLPDSEY